ncbi:MAG: hypothetical protein QOE90_2239 [Thermoplasmata archaeon]|jgi:hypothetical protein|nr:hypothetical protein [Thermoplasmata archaeon]
MRTYLRGERREATVAMLLGLAGIVAAAWLWRVGSPYRWAGAPLLVVGAFQLAGALSHYAGAARRRDALSVQLAQDPGRYQAAELARMHHARATLRYAAGFDVLVLVVGAAVALARRDAAAWVAVGAALALEGALLLALDAWSHARADAYLAHLRRFLTDAGARPHERETAE